MTNEYSMQSVAAEPNDISSWGRGVVKNAGDHMQWNRAQVQDTGFQSILCLIAAHVVVTGIAGPAHQLIALSFWQGPGSVIVSDGKHGETTRWNMWAFQTLCSVQACSAPCA